MSGARRRHRPGGEPRPGAAKATFEWLEGGQLLVERSTVEMRGEWKLWREGEPFNQRFTAISEDGNRIEGRWEYDKGDGWKTDFNLCYTRLR